MGIDPPISIEVSPSISIEVTPSASSEITPSTSTEIEPNDAALKNINLGDIIEFGEYRAASDKEGQKEKIEWIVLKKEDSKFLLMSVRGLDTLPYHTKSPKVTWDESYVHDWLRDYFYEEAFSNSEKAIIVETTVKPEKVWDCNPGEETSDYVFLLSNAEVSAYIENNVYLHGINGIMQCKPTSSVKAQNIYVNDDGYCWWWLRNTTRNNTTAYRVSSNGHVDTDGYTLNTEGGLIRPAMWIDIG